MHYLAPFSGHVVRTNASGNKPHPHYPLENAVSNLQPKWFCRATGSYNPQAQTRWPHLTILGTEDRFLLVELKVTLHFA